MAAATVAYNNEDLISVQPYIRIAEGTSQQTDGQSGRESHCNWFPTSTRASWPLLGQVEGRGRDDKDEDGSSNLR